MHAIYNGCADQRRLHEPEGVPIGIARPRFHTSPVGLLASYFTANQDQADAISRGQDVGDLNAEDGPPLLPTDLGELQTRIVGHEAWSLVGELEESWLIRLGDEFTAKLASLPAPLGDDVADDFQLSADEVDAVEIMRRLALRATSSPGLSVYILISL